jgi:hypothetical protein
VKPDPIICGNVDIGRLPGSAAVLDGIRDLMDGRLSIGSCLASIALPKLRAAGLVPDDFQHPIPNGELSLYRLLLQKKGNAYAKYNALIRELVSFERALATQLRKTSTRSIARL